MKPPIESTSKQIVKKIDACFNALNFSSFIIDPSKQIARKSLAHQAFPETIQITRSNAANKALIMSII